MGIHADIGQDKIQQVIGWPAPEPDPEYWPGNKFYEDSMAFFRFIGTVLAGLFHVMIIAVVVCYILGPRPEEPKFQKSELVQELDSYMASK